MERLDVQLLLRLTKCIVGRGVASAIPGIVVIVLLRLEVLRRDPMLRLEISSIGTR
jgi:hypothetical protein